LRVTQSAGQAILRSDQDIARSSQGRLRARRMQRTKTDRTLARTRALVGAMADTGGLSGLRLVALARRPQRHRAVPLTRPRSSCATLNTRLVRRRLQGRLRGRPFARHAGAGGARHAAA
jgi:hypothetical protein